MLRCRGWQKAKTKMAEKIATLPARSDEVEGKGKAVAVQAVASDIRTAASALFSSVGGAVGNMDPDDVTLEMDVSADGAARLRLRAYRRDRSQR